MNEDIYDAIVVGAGISGLAAAGSLQRSGHTVLVVDKARGVGGRTCVKRIDGAVYDHGAQFLEPVTASDDACIAAWRELGLVQPWPMGDGEGEARRYVGANGMNVIARHLARDLEILLRVRLSEAHWRHGLWHLTDDAHRRLKGKTLILTCPIPQSLLLLESVRDDLTPGVIEELESYYYEPCIALLADYGPNTEILGDGSMKLEAGPIAWISDNSHKGVSPKPGAITIHATAEYSRARYDESDEQISAELLEAASCWLPTRPESVHVHRWRYARPVRQSEFPCLITGAPGPLAFAGDAFCRGTVLGAFHSGETAAAQLVASQSHGAFAEVPF